MFSADLFPTRPCFTFTRTASACTRCIQVGINSSCTRCVQVGIKSSCTRCIHVGTNRRAPDVHKQGITLVCSRFMRLYHDTGMYQIYRYDITPMYTTTGRASHRYVPDVDHLYQFVPDLDRSVITPVCTRCIQTGHHTGVYQVFTDRASHRYVPDIYR